MPSDLVVNFLANVRPFQQGVQQIKAEGKGLVSELGSMASKLPMVGAYLAPGAIVAGIGRMALAMDDVVDAADKMGVSARTYQQWSVVMRTTGGSVDSVRTSMVRMEKAIGEAAAGSKAAQAAMEGLGLSVRDLLALSPEAQFREVAKALADIPSGALRTKLALDILGRGAADLRPLLDAIGAGVDQTVRAPSARATKALAQLGDAMERFKENHAVWLTELAGMAVSFPDVFVPKMEGADAAAAGARRFDQLKQQEASRRAAEDRAKAIADEKAKAAAEAREKAAGSKAADIIKQTQTLFGGLEDRIAGTGMTPEESAVQAARQQMRELTEAMGRLPDKFTPQQIADAQQHFDRLAVSILRAARNAKEAREEQEELNGVMDNAGRLIEENLTPQEKLRDQMERIRDLEESGALGPGGEETAARARLKAAREFIESTGGVRGPSGPLYAEPAIGLQDAWRAVQEIMEQDREDRNREEEKALLESIATSCGIMARTEAEAEALVEISY